MEKNDKKEWKKPQVIDFDVDNTYNSNVSNVDTDGGGTGVASPYITDS